MGSSKKKTVAAFSREKWLETALQTLTETRKSKFNLESLIDAMPVTKGSFYNHFRDRRDFLLALVDFWDRHYTRTVIQSLESLPKDTSPKERLRQLILTVNELKLNRYELLMRSMTLELQEISKAVKKVDLERYDFICAIFADMGFPDWECDLRTRMFMTIVSQEDNLLLDRPDDDRLKQLDQRLDFLTRR